MASVDVLIYTHNQLFILQCSLWVISLCVKILRYRKFLCIYCLSIQLTSLNSFQQKLTELQEVLINLLSKKGLLHIYGHEKENNCNGSSKRSRSVRSYRYITNLSECFPGILLMIIHVFVLVIFCIIVMVLRTNFPVMKRQLLTVQNCSFPAVLIRVLTFQVSLVVENIVLVSL